MSELTTKIGKNCYPGFFVSVPVDKLTCYFLIGKANTQYEHLKKNLKKLKEKIINFVHI